MGVTSRALGTILGVRLGVRLGVDLAPNVLAKFDDSTFTNASDRYLSYGDDTTSVTQFWGGTLAERKINGRNFAQVELAVKNEFTRNQQFDHTDWTKTRSTVTADSVAAPDGMTIADTLVEDATAASTHFITQAVTPDGASSYVFSVYAKQAGRTWIRLQMATAGFPGDESCYFDLANGVLGTSTAGDEGIEDAGNGWYRCWIQETSDAGAATNFDINLAEADNDITFNGDGTSGVYLWNAQLEIGTYPTSPILCGDNLFTESHDLDTWGSARVTVSADALTDPFGTKLADKLVEDVGVATDYYLTKNVTPDGASSYVMSVYAKAGERTWMRLFGNTGGFPSNFTCYFDLANGVKGTAAGVDDSGIIDVGSGWYRCWMSSTSDAAAATTFRVNIAEADNDHTYNGDGSSGLYLFGAQLETGTAPGSYIHTEAAAITGAITRAKDQLHWPSADIGASHPLRRKVTFQWIPYHDNTEASNRYFWQSNGAGERVRCIFNAANR
jgi:hypothetical protein